MTEWFEEWFGEEYLHLYPHRDERDAVRLVALMVQVLPWRPGWKVLDLACGAGRHLLALADSGAQPIGLDLSPSLLARAHETTRAPLVRADLRRLPVRRGTMDLTVNLFTSFGYFETDEEHAEAMSGMLATVKPGGWFALDFLNPAAVSDHLVPSEELALANTVVRVTRSLSDDGRFVIKHIDTPEGRRFTERVRLFSPPELEAMFAANQVPVIHRFGDYQGGLLTAESPRTILIGRHR
ncbi:MAG: class I SAM-dependent methyltransferase [Gemmatimonadales bacterium]